MGVSRSVVRSVASSVVRSVVGVGGLVQRYFTTTIAASSQYWTIPQILSGVSITMDVYPTNGNTGLPPGAPAVTNNVFQTITFTLTGNMDYISREGANYFDGIIANTLVDGRVYPGNEDFSTTSVLIDSAGGQNGAAVNITGSDWFTKQTGGEWLGVELITQNIWENPDSAGSEWTLSNNQWVFVGAGGFNAMQMLAVSEHPDMMRLEGNCVSIAGVLAASGGGSFDIIAPGIYSFDMSKSNITVQQFKRRVGIVNAVLDKPSIKQLLEIA